jgi:hypothetical protein
MIEGDQLLNHQSYLVWRRNVKGYRIVLIMPNQHTAEHQACFGAQLILVGGMEGPGDLALRMQKPIAGKVLVSSLAIIGTHHQHRPEITDGGLTGGRITRYQLRRAPRAQCRCMRFLQEQESRGTVVRSQPWKVQPGPGIRRCRRTCRASTSRSRLIASHRYGSTGSRRGDASVWLPQRASSAEFLPVVGMPCCVIAGSRRMRWWRLSTVVTVTCPVALRRTEQLMAKKRRWSLSASVGFSRTAMDHLWVEETDH